MKSLILLAAIVLITIPVGVQAQKVKADYDHSIDFTKYKTYSWGKGMPASNPQVHLLVIQEIDRQLQSKGLRRVDTGADLSVTYYASLDDNINRGAVEYAKNPDWQKWGDHSPVYGPKMVAALTAIMELDVVDASNNKLIWRGRAKDAYTPNQARGKKRVNRAVEKLLEKFPTTSL